MRNDPKGQLIGERAVAIIQPLKSAIGIEELLERFKSFAGARDLSDVA
ncbi:hypothetical protein OAJ57_04115 [Alphaproteobacteria bacterium]|nr:hypothetical protein [Alphaproteobacteria bacterium]